MTRRAAKIDENHHGIVLSLRHAGGYEALTRVGAEPSRRVEAGVGNAVDNP